MLAPQEALLQFAELWRRGGAEVVAEPLARLLVDATGLWAAPATVARLARDAGIDPDRPASELIATCGSGVSAAVALLSLERIGVHCDGPPRRIIQRTERERAGPIEYGRAA